MDYVRLGSTGLKVSRLCLGTMTYGTPAWRPWVLDESASRPFFKRAIERGINFFDTADMYSRGVSEQVVGPRAEGAREARRGRGRHQGVLSGRGTRQQPRPVAQAHHVGDRRVACAVSAWTTSTCIRSTAPIRTRRSRKRSRPCTTWSRQGRPSTSVRRACMPGSSRRCWPRRRSTAGRASSRCRTTTTWSIAKKNGRCCRSAALKASASFPGARWRGAFSPAIASVARRTPPSASSTTTSVTASITPRPITTSPIAWSQVAREKNVLPIQVALAWVLQQPGVSAPIVGASRLEQLDQLIDGLSVTLSEDEKHFLEEKYVPHPVLGH